MNITLLQGILYYSEINIRLFCDNNTITVLLLFDHYNFYSFSIIQYRYLYLNEIPK